MPCCLSCQRCHEPWILSKPIFCLTIGLPCGCQSLHCAFVLQVCDITSTAYSQMFTKLEHCDVAQPYQPKLSSPWQALPPSARHQHNRVESQACLVVALHSLSHAVFPCREHMHDAKRIFLLPCLARPWSCLSCLHIQSQGLTLVSSNTHRHWLWPMHS